MANKLLTGILSFSLFKTTHCAQQHDLVRIRTSARDRPRRPRTDRGSAPRPPRCVDFDVGDSEARTGDRPVRGRTVRSYDRAFAARCPASAPPVADSPACSRATAVARHGSSSRVRSRLSPPPLRSYRRARSSPADGGRIPQRHHRYRLRRPAIAAANRPYLFARLWSSVPRSAAHDSSRARCPARRSSVGCERAGRNMSYGPTGLLAVDLDEMRCQRRDPVRTFAQRGHRHRNRVRR